jgi:hypothetical protein
MKIPDPPSTPVGTNFTEVVQRTDWFVLTPLPIPVGREYLVDAWASIFKVVTCARCQHGYTYEMVRSEPGGGPDDTRARATAQSSLRVALAKECDPVPCPECGTYQPDMLPRFRHEYRRDLRNAGIRILLAAGLCFALSRLVADPLDEIVPVWITWMAWVAASLAGAGLIMYRCYLGSRYDPNSQPDIERRKEIGRQRVAAAERSIALQRTEDNQQRETRNSQGIEPNQSLQQSSQAIRAVRVITSSPRELAAEREVRQGDPRCPPT